MNYENERQRVAAIIDTLGAEEHDEEEQIGELCRVGLCTLIDMAESLRDLADNQVGLN